MNISIIGAGNLGTAIAADLGRKNNVSIYSSRPGDFSRSLAFKDPDNNEEWSTPIGLVSDSYEEVVTDADIVFIAVPTFLTKASVEHVLPYLRNDALIGFVPGAGGVEYLASEAVKRGNTIFGFERVPYVARLEKYGTAVSASKKNRYRVASIPAGRAGEVSSIIADLFDRPCTPMSEFISMTLTPSLHTSRLYDLYKDHAPGQEYDRSPFFYGEWRDSASYLTFEMDAELHSVCDALSENGISAREVVPYPIHYESATPEQLTKKLRSISSLNRIKGPLIQKENGKFILDIESRYFTESYPYRLCIVKGLAEILGVDVPRTDEVIHWYERLAGKEYYADGKLAGRDAAECNIPQNYGIKTIDELRRFYLI